MRLLTVLRSIRGSGSPDNRAVTTEYTFLRRYACRSLRYGLRCVKQLCCFLYDTVAGRCQNTFWPRFCIYGKRGGSYQIASSLFKTFYLPGLYIAAYMADILLLRNNLNLYRLLSTAFTGDLDVLLADTVSS